MQKDKADRVRIINDLENSDYVTNNYRKVQIALTN